MLAGGQGCCSRSAIYPLDPLEVVPDLLELDRALCVVLDVERVDAISDEVVVLLFKLVDSPLLLLEE